MGKPSSMLDGDFPVNKAAYCKGHRASWPDSVIFANKRSAGHMLSQELKERQSSGIWKHGQALPIVQRLSLRRRKICLLPPYKASATNQNMNLPKTNLGESMSLLGWLMDHGWELAGVSSHTGKVSIQHGRWLPYNHVNRVPPSVNLPQPLYFSTSWDTHEIRVESHTDGCEIQEGAVNGCSTFYQGISSAKKLDWRGFLQVFW